MPKPIPALRALRAESSCVLTFAATEVNAAHLAPSFLDGLSALYGCTWLAEQEPEGRLLDGDRALTALMTGGEGPRVRGFDFDLRRRGLSG